MSYAAIARAMGCDGIRIERPADVAPALASALAGGRPTVIDVVTSPLAAAQPDRAR